MTPYFVFCATIIGFLLGSFLNVLIPRLHFEEKGIWTGRSRCPQCKTILKFMDLIPVVSYLLQKRKCRYCENQISAWYPLVEATGGLTFGALALYAGNPIEWIWLAGFFFILLFIFFYDLRYKEIHDLIMLPGIAFAFIAAFLIGNPLDSLWGALLGGGFFLLQWLISRGRWVGSGDIRIGAFMGAMLGLGPTAVGLILSYFVGSFISIILLLTGKVNRKSTLPLGPFLVIGTVLAFFYGQALIDWYLIKLL